MFSATTLKPLVRATNNRYVIENLMMHCFYTARANLCGFSFWNINSTPNTLDPAIVVILNETVKCQLV